MKLTIKQRKQLIIALILNSLSVAALSQDTIVMKSGEVLIAKVMEISAREVRFKKTDNLAGPVYVERKSQIEQIIYANGVKDKFEDTPVASPSLVIAPADVPVPVRPQLSSSRGAFFLGGQSICENEMQLRLMELNNPKINMHIRHAKIYRGLQNIGFVALPLAAIANYVFIANYHYDADKSVKVAGNLFGLGALCVGGAISFKIMRTHENRATMKLYNGY